MIHKYWIHKYWNHKPTRLAIDFDGVINSYASGYKSDDDSWLPDPPTDGALDFVNQAVKCFDEVVILTTRARSPEGVDAIKKWLKKYGFPSSLQITQQKVWATVYLDDRGYTFKGEFPSLDVLMNFTSWVEERSV